MSRISFKPLRPLSNNLALLSVLTIGGLSVSTHSVSRIWQLPLRSQSKSISQADARMSQLKKLCFERDGSIYLADIPGKHEVKITDGRAPDLSPNGNAIVYMSKRQDVVEPPISAEWKGEYWRLKIFDLARNQAHEFPSLAGVHAFAPHWSHDGTQIAFEVMSDARDRLDLGVLTVATGEWRKITSEFDDKASKIINLDTWVPDDGSLLFHTLEDVFEVTVDGRLLRKIPVSTLCQPGEIGSDTKFSLSSDKRFLLFDRTDSEDMRISVFDLDKNVLLRVTPKSIDATSPIWLPSEKEILFTCSSRTGRTWQRNLCKVGLEGNDLQLLAANADYGSFSLR